MGPISKEAVARALGHLIEEAQQQRVLLQRIEKILITLQENERADLNQTNRRVLELEKFARRVDGHFSPAE